MALFLILIYVSIFTPFKIGFVYDGEYLIWDYLDNTIDFIFMTDIVITFLCATYDDEGNLITERKAIILNYIKGWFLIDLMSSIPFYLIMNDTSQRYNSIARMSKVPKIYRIAKMIKLARMLRLKEIQYVKVINISIGNERFILAFLLLIFSCHVVGCIWFFVATLSEEEDWIYFESHTFDQYIISMYWAVQTVLTVGYGDTTLSNIFFIILIQNYQLLNYFQYIYILIIFIQILNPLNFFIKCTILNSILGLLEFLQLFGCSLLFMCFLLLLDLLHHFQIDKIKIIKYTLIDQPHLKISNKNLKSLKKCFQKLKENLNTVKEISHYNTTSYQKNYHLFQKLNQVIL